MAYIPISINGYHNPIVISGQVYNQSVGAAAKVTIIGSAGRLDLMPFIPAVDMTIVNLSVECTTLVGASNVRILVYSNSNGSPNTKLIESPNLDTSTIGIKTYTVSYTFLAGVTYWVGAHWSSTSALRSISLANLINIGTPAAGGTTNYTLYRLSVAFGSAPATFTGGALTSAIGPEIRFGT